MLLIETKLLAREKIGEFIGVITLNKEQSLNALNLEMVELMSACLEQWRNDDSVVAVLIDGAGDKAFCAGGDVVSMYQSMKHIRTEQQLDRNVKLEHPPQFLREFFSQEYSLDYCINTYPKPIITWGSGIVMGGGLGLFAASKFAIATNTSRFAMPEISIGLFPDVGGSYFLNKMPAGVGLFLALTGASFNGVDACDVNLASHKLSSQSKLALQAQLIHMDVLSEQGIDEALSALQLVDKPLFSSAEAKLKPNFIKLKTLSDAQTLSAAVSRLTAIVSEKQDDRWWLKALKTLNNGSPVTANVVFEQLKRSKDFTLADCFRQELSIALTCSLYGEFEEGVRALLIDKDFAPKWLYQNRDDVPSSLVAAHFTYFADATNPLHHLEQTYGG
jgi:enoyl-CoA hydratase/carnithine racemase